MYSTLAYIHSFTARPLVSHPVDRLSLFPS
jgi:hypothetical protein